MPAWFRIGGRRFAPSGVLTIAAAALIALFVSLGQWQWHRGEARQQQWAGFESGSEIVPLGERGLAEMQRFQRIRVTGKYDPAHQFLLENRTHAGRAGYEVLTPFVRASGNVFLVNRGWVPFQGFRDRLPQVAFEPGGELTITGRIDTLPVAGLARGTRAPAAGDAWPKVTSFPTMAQLSEALGRPLEPYIVLLDADQPHGYVREWQPPGIPPERHWSYAVQWWSFAALAFVFWVVLSLRKEEGQSGK
ncbi:MAG TPA: SURF1 family protein [Steroidobacteraceae bacterium]